MTRLTVYFTMTCAPCQSLLQVVSGSQCFSQSFYGWPYLFMVLSLMWVCNVLANVVHYTTAGAVAAWWVTSDSEMLLLEEEVGRGRILQT